MNSLTARLGIAAAIGLTSGGCSEIQSTLIPHGPEAERIAVLFWVMTWAGGAIMLGVIALAAIAMFAPAGWRRRIASESIVIGGGIVFPVVALSSLLVSGFLITGAGSSPGSDPRSVRIAVVGEQWWWRVIYTAPGGNRVESANEIRIPVGRPIALELTAADVIHSLWVPKLAGKLDMIPGRTNTLRFVANEPGISRGQCAEYCGGAHALMSLYVIAMEEEEFDTWLARESAPAQPPDEPASQGQRLFLASGCGACHTIRGTPALGTIGPDLTHLGSRRSLAAATLPNNAAAIARWITDNQHIKPDNQMPPYGIFSEAELVALSSYLAGLK